jgi:hypothetical protein
MTDTRIDHSQRHPSHIAYAVRDGKDGQKGRWTELGSAWATRDGKPLGHNCESGRREESASRSPAATRFDLTCCDANGVNPAS